MTYPRETPDALIADRANAMCWACWPHNCPRFVLSSSGLVSFATEWLVWVEALPCLTYPRET